MNAAPETFLRQLEADGVVSPGTARLVPLEGGVSSDIYRVETKEGNFVVKRALEKLKVAADWRADLSRNRFEQAYMSYAARVAPGCAPRLLQANPEAGYFCMEYLEGFANWKRDLLSGRCATEIAARAGDLLGRIHRASRGDPEVARGFDAMANFDQLRIDPYLRATASRHPDLAEPILEEAERLANTRECLVHGDYSPKNMLHRDGRLVILDCEVACHADPAFDLAFLLNHLLLKALYHAPDARPLDALFAAALDAYRATFPEPFAAIGDRVRILLPMLLLARVDGKSPVEYLDAGKQAVVRDFARERIRRPDPDVRTMAGTWFAHL